MARIDALRGRLADRGLLAALVLGAPAAAGPLADSPGNIRFLTGWVAPLSPAALVLPASGSPVVLAFGPHDPRGFEAAVPDGAVVIRVNGNDEFARTVADLLGEAGRERYGIAGRGESATALSEALAGAIPGAPVAIDGDLVRLRLTAIGDNASAARRAAEISDAMVDAVMAAASSCTLTGAELMMLAERVGRESGAESAGCWLSTGPAPETTYFETRELQAVVRPGDRVQLGTTVRVDGVYGQCLRMGQVGEPGAALSEHAAILRDIQDRAAALCRLGAPLRAVHETITALVDDACPYPRGRDPFRFQLAHGLGLSYSEPGMRAVSGPMTDEDLAELCFTEGMVVELHPNYSVPGIGHVCLGDMVEVTADGPRFLTRSDRSLRRLGSDPR
ncbi:M24 family metallopeptidase [Microbacterium sp. 2MCAF23]|uniref:M24 family metallopeptidase n=1 Tax=Microbacterium sp. 2MCAF23 TaxID=3232985 RepID=UPI003F979C73